MEIDLLSNNQIWQYEQNHREKLLDLELENQIFLNHFKTIFTDQSMRNLENIPDFIKNGPEYADNGVEVSDIGPVHADFGSKSTDIGYGYADFRPEYFDIGHENADIGSEFVDIDEFISEFEKDTSEFGSRVLPFEPESLNKESKKQYLRLTAQQKLEIVAKFYEMQAKDPNLSIRKFAKQRKIGEFKLRQWIKGKGIGTVQIYLNNVLFLVQCLGILSKYVMNFLYKWESCNNGSGRSLIINKL